MFLHNIIGFYLHVISKPVVLPKVSSVIGIPGLGVVNLG